MDKQVRYIVDLVNPNNPNNLVLGESHRLEDRRFKCLAPYHGSFYAKSVRVFQANSTYELLHNKDFVYSDIDVESSTQLGQPVANVVIVTNTRLGRDFTISYSAVGLANPEVTRRTVALLEAPDDGPVSDSYMDLRKKPEQFLSTFHYQTLSEVENFEYLLFYLERIRLAMVYESITPIRKYLLNVDTIMQVLLEKSTSHFMTHVEIKLKHFREQFTKANFGVDIVPNLELLGHQAAYSVGAGLDKNNKPDGLLAMKALVSFKAGIYDAYLGSDSTLLGNERGTVIPPTLDNYYGLTIGTTVLIDTFSNNTNNGKSFDRLAYPNVHRSNSRFNIKKIVNDLGKRCIVVATEVETHKVFIGNITKTNVGYLAEWREVVRPLAINTSVLDVGAHLANRNNPHRDNKGHIELDLVENIPVAGLFDVIDDSKERKYLRWDLLDKYMKRFLLKRKPSKTEQLEDKDENLMRNISVVFSQCGSSCTGTNECAVIEPVYTTSTTTTTTTPEPVTTTTTPTPTTTTTTTTTTSTTTTAPVSTVIFRDDFTGYGPATNRTPDGPNAGPWISDSYWTEIPQISNGFVFSEALYITGGNNGWSGYAPLADSPLNAYLEVGINTDSLDSRGEIAIGLRRILGTGNGVFCLFSMNDNGTMYLKFDYFETPPRSSPDDIDGIVVQDPTNYVVRLEAQDLSLRAYVDGVLALTVTLNEPSPGGGGLMVELTNNSSITENGQSPPPRLDYVEVTILQ